MYLVAKSIRPVFGLDTVKGSFFLISLPKTIDYIINNLSTKDLILFTNIEPKMLDIGLCYSIDLQDNIILAARISRNKSGKLTENTL